MEPAGEAPYIEALRRASAQIRTLLEQNAALNAALSTQEPIAVIGMGCRFPGGATNPERFWELLARGGDAVAEIPADRFDLDTWWDADPETPGRIYVRDAALLGDVRGFDPGFFSITPAEAESLDPQQRMLLEVSWEALEDARLDSKKLAGSLTGIFIGLSNYDYIQAHVHSGDPERITAYSGSGVMFSTAAGRLSYFYDLRGPCVTLDTACSSSLVALDAAIKALRRGDCDMAVAGGVSLILSPDSTVALCKVRALAADGRSRAFDDAATGYGRGEGCGLVVLKRLEDALRDGDPIQAVLAGSAVNHDGRSNGLTAPNGLAQQAVIRAALDDAKLKPEAIDYIEAHGTGTPLGDPIEFGALDAVFGRRTAGSDLKLGSVKTNIGHTEAAAGIAGVIKVILAMRHETLPPSLHFTTPNHHIDWAASSISVVDAPSPWAARAAGVSSFGLSGTNAHVIVTAPPPVAVTAPVSRSVHALPLSAATPAALAAAAGEWRARMGEGDLADLCATAARRTVLRERLVAIGETAEELSSALQVPEARTQPRRTGGLAFLFTGQGAHYAGMGRALYASEPAFRAAFDRCAAVVGDALGKPLVDLLEDGAALSGTGVAQPVTFALQFALTELWASWGVRPDAVAGHSIGEFAAAVAAGVLGPEDALKLVLERGRLMQALPAGGAMAAVFASADAVAPFLAPHGDRVVIAAINGAESVTLAGEEAALADILAALSARSIDALKLDVSHAFHSPLMKPMLPAFRTACAAAAPRAAGLAFYSTVSGARLPAQERLGADYWSGQIEAPVRFGAAIEAMRADGYDRFLEVGPGDVLSVLARRAGAGLAVSSLKRGVDDNRHIVTAAGALWCDGVDLDWPAITGPVSQRVEAPHYPFQRKPYWLEVGPLRPARWSSGHQEEPATVMAPAKGDRMDSREQVIATLVGMLASITRLDPAEISPDQHLTDMGLDSLMLLKLGQAVEKGYGVELRMSQLFKELGTLSDIQAYLAKHAKRSPGAVVPEIPALPQETPAVPAFVSLPNQPAPAAPLSFSGDTSLFQQQLQAMAEMSAQNLRSLTELTRLQLAATGGAQPAPAPPARIPHVEFAATVPEPARPARPAAPRAVPVAAIRGINLAGAKLSPEQQAYVEDLVRRHVARTGSSKALTRESRAVLADWKHTLSFWGQMKEAKYPIVSAASRGSRVTDIDGNDYIDIAMGMGVHFFGHRPDFIHDALKAQMDDGIELGTQSPWTGKTAQLLTELTGTERVAFSNTGSEVVMVALRLARAATGRSTVVLFKNSYHGIFDGVLATEEDGETVPIGIGTPAGMIEDLVVLPYDSPASLDYIKAHGDALAAVLVEPVQSRNPDLQPQGFLKALYRLTRESGTALIFDEMINGFRAGPGGAREWFDVDADMALYGKIVGGGMPIGVIAGKARYLDYIDGGDWDYGDRSGPQSEMIYFGGTFCRNPATMVTTHAALAHMKAEGPALQDITTARTTAFCDRLNRWFERERVPLRAKHFSSQWRIVPIGAQDREPIELELLYLSMMVRGVYTWERRISFFSTEHSPADIAAVFDAITGSIEEIRANGFDWSIEDYPHPQFTALSSPERRMFVLAQREGGDAPYHLPQAFFIDGPLDVERMEEAFRTIVMRHEGLRTAFVTIDGEPLASCIAEPRFAIERAAIAEDEADAFIEQFVRPFDLAVAPLMRVAVATITPERHLLVADAHHIAVDGLSFDIVAGELMALYAGESLPAVDYDLREARRAVDAGASGERGAENEAFWKAELADLPSLDLPTDRPRPIERDFRGDAVFAQVPAELTTRLKALGRQTGTSLYMVLLAAWSGFLHRLTDQQDVVIGGATSGREDSAVAQAVGMFVNTVAFRTRPDAALPFAQHLAAVARTALAAYDHGDYPFEAAAALAAPPSPGRNAIFDTMLSYENATARAFQIEQLSFTGHDVPLAAAMFDLALEVTELEGAMTLRFGFATALFDRATIEHWSAAFVKMLEQIPGDPDRPLGRIDMLSDSERAVIAAVNDTAAAYSQEATLVSLFDASVTAHADRPAVRSGETVLSYAELDRASDALAAALVERAPAGACVGVLLPRSERIVVAELAILKAGCVFVPLDTGHPEALLDHILSDSACAVVLTEAATKDLLPAAHRDRALDIGATGTTRPDRVRAPGDVAYIIYTSGSTGRPKGCQVTHRNAVRLLVNDRNPFAFGPEDVLICAHSFAFDFSIWEVWCALAHGGSVVIAGADDARDPAALLGLVRRHRVTILNQTPAAFYGLIEAEAAQPAHDLADHLHTVIFGGDRLEPAYLRPWAALYPLDGIALVNMYGITETTVHVTWHRLGDADLASGRSSIGRPIPETTVDVLSPAGLPQPIGVPGELWVGGSGVCAGYLNRPELTAERFATIDGRRLYRTGDIGRLRADGALDYLGRNDHQVQIRGHRIELAGVQYWLLEHPQVEKAVVLERDDADEGKQLIAYVVGDAGLTAEALRAHLARTLPDYAIPARFVSLPELPKTANGKLDRAALPADAARMPVSASAAAPRTDTEKAIAAVWAEVLALPQVGADQNYFALGGDSIKALQIVGRLHRAGIEISLSQLLGAKTVTALAALVGSDAGAAAAAPLGDAAPLTPIQNWFLETHGDAPGHFNNAALLAAEHVDAGALERAVATVVAHHDALRLAVDPVLAVQRVMPAAMVPIEIVEVPGTAALTAHAAAAQAGFDIARPPLLRVILYRLPEGERVLILCHHLVIDGVSWRILIEDLLAAYAAELAGETVALPASGPWLAWPAALEQAARSPELLAETPYWQAVEAAEVAPVPCDYDAPVNAVADHRTVSFELDEAATRRLFDAVADEGGIAPQLIGALGLGCRECWGLDRLRVRLEGHGREEIAPGLDLSRTIGWFTSIFPALFEIGDADGLSDAAGRVAATLRAIPRKGVGYGVLRYLAPGAFKAGPAPEIGFNYLGQFDAELGGGFRLADEPTGPLLGGSLHRPELIDVESAIVGGGLSVQIGYGERQHARATIERLAEAMREALTGSTGDTPSSELLDRIGTDADNIEAVLALSPLQEGMVFHAMAGDRQSYLQQFTYRVTGTLDLERFAAAWQLLAARHQALRTAIVALPGEAPHQIVLRHRPVPIAVEDISGLARTKKTRAIDALAAAERERGFDLARDPLMRITLARLGAHDTDVIWTSHHVILDGWSIGIAQEELIALYQALAEDRAPALPPAPPFARHIDWLATQDQATGRRFWANRLADAPAPASIPGLRAAPDGLHYAMTEHVFALDRETTAGLTGLAARLEVTLNTVVQALWAALLAGYNGSDDVVFGAIASGRPSGLADVERMVGLFLQPLPVRARIAAGDSFATLARRLQQDANEAEPFHYLSLAEMQRLDGKRRTLFDHVLVFENYPFAEAPVGGLTVGTVRSVEQMHFDYSLVVQPGEQLEVKFTFNANAVHAAEFDRIEAQWRALTAALLDDADRPLADIDLGIRTEHQTAEAISGTVLDLFEARAAAQPEAIAIEQAGEAISYHALNARAEALARALGAMGVGRGDRVISFQPNGVDHVATMIAVWKAAAIFVPLDTEAPARRLKLLAGRIDPVALVTSQALRDRLVGAVDAPPERLVVWEADGVFEGLADGPDRTERPGADDPAYVMFTSGSTGEPKPILSSHGGLRHFIDWESAELGVGAGVRVSNLALPTFDVSLRDIFLPLAVGGTICIVPPEARRDGGLLAAWLAESAIEVAHVVPSIFRLALKAMEERPVALPRLRHLLFAGEILWGADVERARALLGADVQLRNLYGPSETTLAKCCFAITGPVDAARAVPVGAPLPGTQLLIVKDGKLAAPGAIGEIHIAPPFVPLGYLDDPKLTADYFIPCPAEWGSEGLFYRTGDLGRALADGSIEVCGRLDGQVKVNGVRVELAEIEQAAMASDEVDAAVAIAHKREDGEVALACYYTTKHPLDPAALRDRLALDLPQAVMPHFLVPLDAMPLSLNGKIDRRALPRPEELVTGRIAYVAPEGAVEERIAAIWMEVLGLKRVGVCTSFFDVGGDSLRAIRVLTRANAEYGGALTIGGFFAAPTVRAMAAALRPQDRQPGTIVALAGAPDYPVSHAQQRLWVLAQMGGNPAAYTLSAAYRLDGPLDADALAAAIEALPVRHEALRTVFVATGDGLRQRVLPQADFHVTCVDLSGDSDPDAAAAALAETRASEGFDLATGPLLSASLLKLGADRHVLLFGVHHIVSDAVSVTVMIEEIVRTARGEQLPPLRIHYKDYAATEAAWLKTPEAGTTRAWWHDQLADLPERLDLPFDRLPAGLPSHEGDRVSVDLDATAMAGLRQLSMAAGGTLFAGLVGLAAALLQRHSGCDDLVLGMPVSCRDDPELEEQVGFYVNLLPLRIGLTDTDSLGSLVKRVGRTMMAAIDHRGYPFDRLVDELAPGRDDSRPPLFDVAMVFQDSSQRSFVFDGVEITPLGGEPRVAKYPLTFEFVETASGVTLNLEYATDLFDRARIERMADHFQRLLGAALAEPGRPISGLDMLGVAERALLLAPGPKIDLPEAATVPAMFAGWVEAAPDAPAVSCAGATLTYAELDARAKTLARALAGRGIGHDDVVAVLLDRSEQLVVAFMGILMAGAIYLPLDPTYPAERLEMMLADSSARLLLTEKAHAGALEEAGVPVLDIAALENGPSAEPVPPGADDLAYLIYTSGSTGRPKGVLLEHRGAVNLALAQRRGLGIAPRHHVLQFAPSSFDASVWEMVMALLNGACLVVAGPDQVRDPLNFAAYLAAEKVTVATLPPTYLAELDDAALAPLELLITAGEKPDSDRAVRLAATLTAVNAYGPTETTVCASWHHVDPATDADRAIPIGRAIGNMAMIVLDRFGNPAPIGVPGEIHIGGVGLARGYLGRPELTEAAFVAHPFMPGARLYRTGDRGTVSEDGAVRFAGRSDRQVKLRGYRIELPEIERAIARLPGVAEVAVAVRQGPTGSELVAFVVPDGRLTVDALMEDLARTLPGHMLPGRWTMLKALPMTPNGKVDYKALPEPDDGAAETPSLDDEREELVANAWRKVLGRGGFGRHDRFFTVGGDSIRAIQVVGLLRTAGHAIEMRAFLAAPTVAGIAALLSAPAEPAPAPVSGRVDLAEVEGLFGGE
ncbi:MAG: putative non ribosomal peptide synthetase protein [Sphingomonas bacterium]|uniref:type I polyketide synthase n=1 Tax=Sphingomonas bacterium TaxID=1895847 RepID=UPI00261DA498|nr:hybrid non-ribosomal peptide synthetase/type I polyketide synthase [Sphingomonas bacterium]MDB5707596.1 putative non ribosomal peptide synthetase protein [Sphingomonas bacterium]